MDARKMLKTNPPKDNNGVPLKVYVADDLTKRGVNLAYQARQFKRAKRIADTCVMYCKIYIKDNHNHIKLTNTTEDLRKFQPTSNGGSH